MKTEQLTVTRTNSAKDFSGQLYGVDAPLLLYIVIPLAVGLFGFVALMSLDLSPLWAGVLGLAPAVITAAYILVFVQGRPPGYARDWFCTWLTKGDAVPPLESSANQNWRDES